MASREKPMFSAFIFLITIFIFSAFSAGAADKPVKTAKTGTITGQIMIKDGGPLAGGHVIFYNVITGPEPAPEKYSRIPDVTKVINEDGSFRAELPAGKYYMGAIKRVAGERYGPQEGDYTFISRDDKNRLREYIVKEGDTVDIGVISEAVPFKAAKAGKDKVTAIQGIVVDAQGKPVADAIVVAFKDATLSGKPLFVSDKTGKDGKYILRLTEGKYYLRVRNIFASGPPVPGQIVGFYGEGTPAAVSVKDGELKKDIDFRVIRFPGRGPFSVTPPPAQ